MVISTVCTPLWISPLMLRKRAVTAIGEVSAEELSRLARLFLGR